MDMKLKPFDFASAVARAGLGVDGTPLKSQKVQAPTGGSFQTALTAALDGVSKTQNDSIEMQRQVTLENPTVSLEETMVSMQKAQIGFQAALTVRNKLTQAYTDIMNMSV
ncbi:MAG: flagellar hook-basal body protein [Rhizobacter sp.]|nr:flagellar hook-basal body protein [Rhizobacter sp.]